MVKTRHFANVKWNNYETTLCILLSDRCCRCSNHGQWSYIQDDPAIQAQANNMAEDAFGNIIAVGGAFGYPLLGDGPPRVTKLDASGNLIWEVELSVPAGIGSISASGVSVVDDGYIIFCGGFENHSSTNWTRMVLRYGTRNYGAAHWLWVLQLM